MPTQFYVIEYKGKKNIVIPFLTGCFWFEFWLHLKMFKLLYECYFTFKLQKEIIKFYEI